MSIACGQRTRPWCARAVSMFLLVACALAAAGEDAPGQPPSAAQATTAAQNGAATAEQTPKPELLRVSLLAWSNTSAFGEAPWLAEAGADAVAAQLTGHAGVVVLEREAVSTLMAEGQVAVPATNASAAATHASAASLVIGGTYHTDGSTLSVELRVVRPGAATTIWSDHRDGRLSDYAQLCRGLARACVPALLGSGAVPGQEPPAPPAPPLAAMDAYYRGRKLIASGEPERAVADLLRAVASSPTFTAAWDDLGAALVCCGHDGAADAAFRRARDIDPDDASGAMELYRTAVQLRPRLPALANRLESQIKAEHPFTYRTLLEQAARAVYMEQQYGQRSGQ